MPVVIPVKFTYAARDLWFDPQDSGAKEGDHVICTTARGVEMGICTRDPFEVSEAELAETLTDAPLREVLKVADAADYERADELARLSSEAFPIFRRLALESGLEMKPVATEYIFGGDKVVCYFAAEERVDFRQLVRDLSHELHERIDMRQIGVREEAALVGGFAHCGQELCCSRFGTQFEPVSIRMAKEQDLPLNSSKISGACGRLMCCLRYEFEAYRDFKSRAPKRNAVIDTPLGKAKIMEYDTPKEQLCLRLENGKQLRVALGDMTCSEDACKKSEELGCACRPDTVTRDVLDRIDSPEVQMALAELDREMGILPAEEIVEVTEFPTLKPRRTNDSQRKKDAKAEGASEKAPKKRRIRRIAKNDEAQSEQAGSKVTKSAEKDAQKKEQSDKKHGMRRRRHRGGAKTEGNAAANNKQNGSERKTSKPAPKMDAPTKKKVTRRPGDHGHPAEVGKTPARRQTTTKVRRNRNRGNNQKRPQNSAE